MRSMRAAVAAMVVVGLTAAPAQACQKERHGAKAHKKVASVAWDEVLLRGIPAADRRVESSARKASAPGTKDLSPYQGLGSWVDIFNTKPWANPARVVRTMHARGATAIFLQTSTYGQAGGIYDRKAVDSYLHLAHKRGMKVVAWYVPAFDQQEVDFRRVRRAIRYRSPSGERFDSFGLDIEAINVSDIGLRNKRLISLSKRIRRLVGPNYALGAITPDPVEASYWPDFPYKELAKVYDVFVPMGYFTFRASGFKDVHDYTDEGIRTIRRETGDPNVPIHFIGGIADDARPHELKGFVKAARDHGIEGASLYDYPITSRESWFQMRALSKEVAARRRAAEAARKQAEAEREKRLRDKRRDKAAENKGDVRKPKKDEASKKAKAKKAKKRRNSVSKGRDKADAANKRKGKNASKKARSSSKRTSKPRRKASGKNGDDAARGRRSPSSSASRPDKRWWREGERERLHLHAPDHRPLRS